jgi:N-acetylglucosamine-6-sulfatase
MNPARLEKAKPLGMGIMLALAAGVAMALVVTIGVTASHPESSSAQTVSKPNIIYIVTDDMRKDDLNSRYMPKTISLLANRGMTFKSAFVSTAWCCPSRATTMRGQYAHNTGVWSIANSYDPDPGVPDGGWEGYKGNGLEDDNIATRLDAAGYRTGLFGKYLNNYEGTTKPLGWDDWFAFRPYEGYYNYYINDNGTLKHFDRTASSYSTDVLSRETRQFVGASVARSSPFFAYVAPYAPKNPFYGDIPRHEHDFDGEKAPRLPSFNEGDVSDKPPWIRALPILGSTKIATINKRHEDRVESLRSVDDLVGAVVNKLSSYPGVLENTYIVFTSDNGWHLGEHRIPEEKNQPYEESHRVPLVVFGPGVQAGSTTDKLALNTDHLPTFTDLAGAQQPSYVDGRSLRPVLEGSATTWRTAILLEGHYFQSGIPKVERDYSAIRTSTAKYVEYQGGFREAYDLAPGADPYELNNFYYKAASNVAPRPELKARLDALKTCAGADASATSCKTAEGG